MTVNCLCSWLIFKYWGRTLGCEIKNSRDRHEGNLPPLTAPTCCSVNIYIPSVSPPIHLWPFLSGLGEHTFLSSLCNWPSFPLPDSYSVFILSVFSTTTAPIVPFLLSNWQPTLSLMCRKCFITMGRAQPSIMHGEHACRKKERVWFLSVEKHGCFRAFSEGCCSCGGLCFGHLSPISSGIFRLCVADIQSIHMTDSRVEVSFSAAPCSFPHISFIRKSCHMSRTFNTQIKDLNQRAGFLLTVP